jgi:hypothetical protein
MPAAAGREGDDIAPGSSRFGDTSPAPRLDAGPGRNSGPAAVRARVSALAA